MSRPAYNLVALYGSGALWNICMGMLQVLVPLYALSLGFSIIKKSILVSLPVLAELVVRFGGSAISDRFGERRVLQICFLLMALSGATLLVAGREMILFPGTEKSGWSVVANCQHCARYDYISLYRAPTLCLFGAHACNPVLLEGLRPVYY